MHRGLPRMENLLTDRRYMSQHSNEYINYIKSPRWKLIRGINKSIWFGRCSFNPLDESVQVHHLHYHRKFGWEIPLLDTIPVSVKSHQILEKPPWKVKILVGNRWIAQPDLRRKFNNRLRFIALLNWIGILIASPLLFLQMCIDRMSKY